MLDPGSLRSEKASRRLMIAGEFEIIISIMIKIIKIIVVIIIRINIITTTSRVSFQPTFSTLNAPNSKKLQFLF